MHSSVIDALVYATAMLQNICLVKVCCSTICTALPSADLQTAPKFPMSCRPADDGLAENEYTQQKLRKHHASLHCVFAELTDLPQWAIC